MNTLTNLVLYVYYPETGFGVMLLISQALGIHNNHLHGIKKVEVTLCYSKWQKEIQQLLRVFPLSNSFVFI